MPTRSHLAAALVLLTATACQTFAPRPTSAFEVVAELDTPPGNIAVTPDGRIFVSQHPFAGAELRVVEVHDDGTTSAFPNEVWSRAPQPGSDVGMHAVLGIESDSRGVVWMLDLGSASTPAKLVAWDTTQDALHRLIEIGPPAKGPNSFIQDLAIDLVHGAIYLADMGRADLVGDSRPALLVVDLDTGTTRRALFGHRLLQPERGADIAVNGRRARIASPDGPIPSNGLNPITIDAEAQHVYFGAMNGRSVYRVATTDLLDATLDDDALAARVEVVGSKGVSDGISIDTAGNVYVTDINSNAIGVLETNGRYRTLHRDDALISWPDGISFGPDGMGYVTVNQLHRHAPLHGGVDVTRPPFRIVRFEPLAPGGVGR